MNRYEILALFDIDKTLVEGLGGHVEAFSEAFKKVYNVEADIFIINPHGMTDQEIIFKVLKKKGLNGDKIKSKINECMDVMAKSFLEPSKKSSIKLMDGVTELLKELSKKNILLGLVTGNLEKIARGKLRRLGVNDYFKIGGFGSDDISRTNLVKLAIRRAEKRFDFKADNNVYLFGDAPQDTKAAKEAGIKAIGVTTGIYSRNDLLEAGADDVLESLIDIGKILRILKGGKNA